MVVGIVHSSTQISGIRTFIETIIFELDSSGHQVYLSIWEEGIIDLSWVEKMKEYCKVSINEGFKRATDITIFNSAPSVFKSKNVVFESTRTKFVVHSLMQDTMMPPKGRAFDQIICLSELAYHYIKGENKVQLGNVIDFQKFKSDYLPKETLKNVLLVDMRYAPIYQRKLEEACQELNLHLRVIPSKDSKYIANMTLAYELADLVVGYGRVALEAIGTGRPVIVYGINGGDGYINSTNFEEVNYRNMSGWSLRNMPPPSGLTKDHFITQLQKYYYRDGEKLRDMAIQKVNIKDKINILIG